MGKRKGNFYKQGAKKARYGSKLDAGMRGVIITCNKRERESVREAYNILNEYADRLYGPEQKPDSGDASSEEEEEEDIEAALSKEVASLKQTKATQRRFQQVDTGTNNVVFVRTPLENPTELIRSIYEDCIASQQSKSRFILRLLPVIGTCTTHDNRVSTTALELYEPLIGHGRPITYSIHIKVRNNNGVSRTSLLPVLGRVIEELNPNASVDFNNPEVIINIDVLKTVCCFGFLTDFTKFRKYNLQEIIVAKRTVNKVKKKVVEVSESDKSVEKKGEEDGEDKGGAVEGGLEQTDQDQKMEQEEGNENQATMGEASAKVEDLDTDNDTKSVGAERGLGATSVDKSTAVPINGAHTAETELTNAEKSQPGAPTAIIEPAVGAESKGETPHGEAAMVQNEVKCDVEKYALETPSKSGQNSNSDQDKKDC